jgi:hypothetical protein
LTRNGIPYAILENKGYLRAKHKANTFTMYLAHHWLAHGDLRVPRIAWCALKPRRRWYSFVSYANLNIHDPDRPCTLLHFGHCSISWRCTSYKKEHTHFVFIFIHYHLFVMICSAINWLVLVIKPELLCMISLMSIFKLFNNLNVIAWECRNE